MQFVPAAPGAVLTGHVHGPNCGCPDHHHHHEHDGIACACGHDHSEEGHSHSGVGLDFQLGILLPLTIAMLVLAKVLDWLDGSAGNGGPVAVALGILATLLAGGPIIWSAIKGLAKGRTNVNELVAMSIIGAVSLGWFVEAGFVALILQIGALIEGVATDSARKAVLALQKLAPKHARVRAGGQDRVIPVEQLQPGDVMVVQPGESVAADGKIVSGTSALNQASVTGESVPVDKGLGDEVLSGTINLTGSLEVSVQRVGEHSALGRMIALVKRAQQFQPQIIRAADKFFAFYTPIILLLSLIVLWVTRDPVRMVTMWVVGCPCAMLLASPLAIVVSMTRASRSGIQVKAGPFVEASAAIQTVVFDKTGTLTTGEFVVAAVRVVDEKTEARSQKPEENPATRRLLELVATIEQRSSHPLARSIVNYALSRGIQPSAAADVQVLEGLGVEARINGQVARAGSVKIVPDDQAALAARIDHADESLPVVPVYVVLDGKLLGAVYLTDQIRPEAARTISRLRSLGVRKIAMLTGDRKRTAELVARAVGCDEVYSELMPADKVRIVRGLQRGGQGVVMVGDGINDGAALAAATVGVALGVRGTDVAVEAADAVLLKDDLRKVPLLLFLAKQTRSAIYQNLGIALGFTVVVEAAVASGIITVLLARTGMGYDAAQLWTLILAAIAHVLGVVVIAVNSVRLAGTGPASTTWAPKTESAPVEEPVAAAVPA